MSLGVSARGILAVAVIVTVGWADTPHVSALYRVFRTDTEFTIHGTAGYTLGTRWQPRLRWESNGRMSYIGALERDKRDSGVKALLSLTPHSRCTVEFATTGWRRRDMGATLIERGVGAATEAAMSLAGPYGLSFTQRAAAIRDRVASAGLGGEESDNGGVRGDSQIRLERTVLGLAGVVELGRSFKDVRLEGSDDRTVRVRLDGTAGSGAVEGFSRERRYRTGSVTERRTETGHSLRLGGAVTGVVSWEYRGDAASSEYREGTNQDFSSTSQEARVDLRPTIPGAARPFVKLSLRHRSYDERDRTVYDREDIGRAVEAGCTVSMWDSLLTCQIGHQLSLDRTAYVDPANFSDHDIRDQRINGDIAWARPSASVALGLVRRRNDLVYVDAQRSANTVRNEEYAVSAAYTLRRWRLVWSQNGTISARHASYRFKPDASTLSRRGLVESTLSVDRRFYTAALYGRWLWDDTGPYRRGVFSRLELTEDVEVGMRMSATVERWKIEPGMSQRWRLFYGPGGRTAGLARPTSLERRATIGIDIPMGSSGIVVKATRVLANRRGYWEASAEVKSGA